MLLCDCIITAAHSQGAFSSNQADAGTSVGHYRPLFEMSFYREIGFHLPVFSQRAYARRGVVSLPL